ncbi:hypothetical protein A3Q56_04026 [Intoshia linei]|uniref:Uncharacterized protein n=1 Tax=Intoshia linei TaxID=1819745 RepID=A0A177B485_9BILA|nr:hypothetical protein A3Q56_04026 [Intoshia linei]
MLTNHNHSESNLDIPMNSSIVKIESKQMVPAKKSSVTLYNDPCLNQNNSLQSQIDRINDNSYDDTSFKLQLQEACRDRSFTCADRSLNANDSTPLRDVIANTVVPITPNKSDFFKSDDHKIKANSYAKRNLNLLHDWK